MEVVRFFLLFERCLKLLSDFHRVRADEVEDDEQGAERAERRRERKEANDERGHCIEMRHNIPQVLRFTVEWAE